MFIQMLAIWLAKRIQKKNMNCLANQTLQLINDSTHLKNRENISKLGWFQWNQ